MASKSFHSPRVATFNIESLEHRTLLSAAQVSFSNFSSVSHLVSNGFGGAPINSGDVLRLTTSVQHESRSVWYDRTVPIERFHTDFTFKSPANANGADGLTLTLHNGDTTALGADGRGLGYGNISGNSVAIAFNQFNFHNFGSKFGIAVDGERPPTNTPLGAIDLHSGHAFRVSATYDGTALSVFVTDASDSTKKFSATRIIDLRSVLGTSRAIVGFTAATGEDMTTQDVLSWSFAGSMAPVPAPVPTKPHFAVGADATPEPVTGTTTALSALGVDSIDAETALKYRWSVISAPSGAATPKFSENGSNDAKSIIATFFKDGSYVLRCTVINSAGLKANSDVAVHVSQTASSVAVSPHLSKVTVNRHLQFEAMMLDQFGRPMRVQPKFKFAVSQGTGTIKATVGLYTAPSAEGHDVITAYAAGLEGSVGVMIKAANTAGPHGASA